MRSLRWTGNLFVDVIGVFSLQENGLFTIYLNQLVAYCEFKKYVSIKLWKFWKWTIISCLCTTPFSYLNIHLSTVIIHLYWTFYFLSQSWWYLISSFHFFSEIVARFVGASLASGRVSCGRTQVRAPILPLTFYHYLALNEFALSIASPLSQVYGICRRTK